MIYFFNIARLTWMALFIALYIIVIIVTIYLTK